MEGKENILEELRQISVFVAEISRVTPYGLPEGYFEDLAGKVLVRIRAGEAPRNYGTANTFDLFQPDIINPTSDKDQTPNNFRPEFAEPEFASPEAAAPELPASFSTNPVYSVPSGYFEGFAEKLMGRIKAAEITGAAQTIKKDADKSRSALEDPAISSLDELTILSPLLSRIDKKMPFGVPEGYFSSLPAVATATAKEGEYLLSPLMTGLKNKPTYQAPEGYFNTLTASILEKAQQKTGKQEEAPVLQPAAAKIISFDRSRNLKRNWWKYAAAAVMTGLILTGGWLKLHNTPSNPPVDIAKSLSNVSDSEIQNYLDNQNLPLSDELANSTASLDISDNDIKSLLGDIPDGELKQYIDENGDAKDLATN